jgi:hypothetical protein
MKQFFPAITFGVVLIYTAILLVLMIYAVATRRVPAKIKIPGVIGSLGKIRGRLR